MSDASLYAFYASKEVAAPVDDYWAQRRKLAGQIRQLQECLQTTELSIDELAVLSRGLEGQLQQFNDKPRLLGRKDWVDAKAYGGAGIFQVETTPIIGSCNPVSPGLSIWFEQDKVFAAVTFNWMYEGALNIVHGGWIAAVFDEFLGTAQVISGVSGMTACLTTTYHKPTPLNTELRLSASVKSLEGRKITLLAEMWAGEVMTASCEGLFIGPALSKETAAS